MSSATTTESAAAEVDRDRLYARYEGVFAAIAPPFAFVDLDALRTNADALLRQATGLPIRIASKSVRSVDVLRRILALDDGFRGILSFTAPEALHLRELGFTDIVVAYPTVDRGAIAAVARAAAEDPGSAPALMVDEVAHLDLIESTIGAGAAAVPVLIDIDASWWPARGRVAKIGPKRSPIRAPEQAAALAAEVEERPGTSLRGVMSYEGHIAGVADDLPGRPLRSAAIRYVQARSEEEIGERLPRVLEAIRDRIGRGPEIVNCGGTGSLERTAALGLATELTAGSGFYAPALFDGYRSLDLRPAAFFCLPIVRRPHPGVVTALGGGYVASGSPGRDRLPDPYLPAGLGYDRDEGAGEVQTPLVGAAARGLRVGDRVYMRHAKAGELCERFNSLYIVEGDAIVAEVATYRGDGHAFL